MNGHAQIFLNPNRENSGEQWLWSYFEPDTGLDVNRVELLWGNLNLPMDQYNVQTKSRFNGYDVQEKIAERKEHGYILLKALPADNLEIVKALISTWQTVLYRKELVVVSHDLFKTAREGVSVLGGNIALVSDLNKPVKLQPLRLLVAKKSQPSRYNW